MIRFLRFFDMTLLDSSLAYTAGTVNAGVLALYPVTPFHCAPIFHCLAYAAGSDRKPVYGSIIVAFNKRAP